MLIQNISLWRAPFKKGSRDCNPLITSLFQHINGQNGSKDTFLTGLSLLVLRLFSLGSLTNVATASWDGYHWQNPCCSFFFFAECEDEDEEEEEDEEAEVVYRGCVPMKRQNEVHHSSKSPLSSTSSGSSDNSGVEVDTPVIQSDDEEVHADTLLLTSVPQTKDEETEEEDEEEGFLASKPS